ncbi:MAG: arginyltransferase [Phycisphaerae bacterium]|nr:arginyltransferase [Phycisphaerae bacterium]
MASPYLGLVVRQFGRALPLLKSGEYPCPYLAGRTASVLVNYAGEPDATAYQQFMDSGFRRAGDMIYMPSCKSCAECVPIRVPVDEFEPSDSMRRALRKNEDVDVQIGEPAYSDERFELYRRYQAMQHDNVEDSTPENYERSFVQHLGFTEEMTYWTAGRLVGVGTIDITERAVSSVYFFYDPQEARRSLGVFSVMCEIELCRRRGLPYWYSGYFVADCRKMSYKARYQPAEFLHGDGQWRRFAPRSGGDAR